MKIYEETIIDEKKDFIMKDAETQLSVVQYAVNCILDVLKWPIAIYAPFLLLNNLLDKI